MKKTIKLPIPLDVTVTNGAKYTLFSCTDGLWKAGSHSTGEVCNLDLFGSEDCVPIHECEHCMEVYLSMIDDATWRKPLQDEREEYHDAFGYRVTKEDGLYQIYHNENHVGTAETLQGGISLTRQLLLIEAGAV